MAASTRSRILEAARQCVAQVGLSRTTVRDVARRAGLSRATVYRCFPGGRDEVTGALVAEEHARFFEQLYHEVRTAPSLEEVLVRGLQLAHRAIEDHRLLQRVLEAEPELLLPALTVRSAETQRAIASFLRPHLVRHGLAPGVDVDEAADLLARMVLSYIAAPGRWDLRDRGQIEQLVRGELLAGVAGVAGERGGR